MAGALVVDMTAWDTLGILLLAAFLGVVGQSARTLMGVVKHMRGKNDKFAYRRIYFSFFIAFVVGVVSGVFSVFGFGIEDIRPEQAWAILGAGYAGTDFIEGSIKSLGRGK